MSTENISKEWGTVCSHRDADVLLKDVPVELAKYVVDKEAQNSDDLIFVYTIKYISKHGNIRHKIVLHET